MTSGLGDHVRRLGIMLIAGTVDHYPRHDASQKVVEIVLRARYLDVDEAVNHGGI